MNSAFSGGDATQRENGSISRYEKIAVEVSRSNAAVSRFVDDDSDAVDLLCAIDPAAVARLQAVHAVAGKVEQRGGAECVLQLVSTLFRQFHEAIQKMEDSLFGRAIE